MRILHVVTTLDVGGAEMHLLSQARGQTARGHEVRMAYLKGEGRLADDFRAAGAEVAPCLGQGPGALLALRRHLAWADVAHSHLLKADAVTAVAALLSGRRRRLLSGKHNDERALLRPAVARVHGLLSRVPARIVALSDHVGRFVVEQGRAPADRIERIYYGLDPAPFEAAAAAPADDRAALRASLGIEEGDVVFTCVARFAPQKAHDVLLRAFAAARAEAGPSLRLLLVGDDPFGDGRVRAEEVAAQLDLGASVVFAGIRRDVPALLAASDVFAMASLWEGLGLVFLEAMATDLPVLATRVSAIPEVVLDGETGLLVPPGEDGPLAAAMVRLAADPGLRADLGAAGHRRVLDRFGLDRMVDETLALYARVVAEA